MNTEQVRNSRKLSFFQKLIFLIHIETPSTHFKTSLCFNLVFYFYPGCFLLCSGLQWTLRQLQRKGWRTWCDWESSASRSCSRTTNITQRYFIDFYLYSLKLSSSVLLFQIQTQKATFSTCKRNMLLKNSCVFMFLFLFQPQNLMFWQQSLL